MIASNDLSTAAVPGPTGPDKTGLTGTKGVKGAAIGAKAQPLGCFMASQDEDFPCKNKKNKKQEQELTNE